jgi:hypothetical protein
MAFGGEGIDRLHVRIIELVIQVELEPLDMFIAGVAWACLRQPDTFRTWSLYPILGHAFGAPRYWRIRSPSRGSFLGATS